MSHPDAGEVTGRMTDEGVSHSENNTQEHALSPKGEAGQMGEERAVSAVRHGIGEARVSLCGRGFICERKANSCLYLKSDNLGKTPGTCKAPHNFNIYLTGLSD